jgi:hypothetical protein
MAQLLGGFNNTEFPRDRTYTPGFTTGNTIKVGLRGYSRALNDC